jgi:hypothetical protein
MVNVSFGGAHMLVCDHKSVNSGKICAHRQDSLLFVITEPLVKATDMTHDCSLTLNQLPAPPVAAE